MLTEMRPATAASRSSALDRYRRAANYLGTAQLYLRDNVLLRRPLSAADCKPRILGRWGTQPGLNLIYAHLNRLVSERDAELLLIVGPGHGAPAIYATLFLEGTLGALDSRYARDEAGATALARAFSWPGGLPNPHGLADARFDELFTAGRTVVCAYHGYPRTVHELIYRRSAPERFHIRGYIEEDTTTTPFDMVVLNRVSRFDLALDALRRAAPAR